METSAGILSFNTASALGVWYPEDPAPRPRGNGGDDRGWRVVPSLDGYVPTVGGNAPRAPVDPVQMVEEPPDVVRDSGARVTWAPPLGTQTELPRITAARQARVPVVPRAERPQAAGASEVPEADEETHPVDWDNPSGGMVRAVSLGEDQRQACALGARAGIQHRPTGRGRAAGHAQAGAASTPNLRRVVGFISQPALIKRVLDHLPNAREGLSPPSARPAASGQSRLLGSSPSRPWTRRARGQVSAQDTGDNPSCGASSLLRRSCLLPARVGRRDPRRGGHRPLSGSRQAGPPGPPKRNLLSLVP